MKKKINHFLAENLLLKLLGVILAIVLWLLLTNIQDPIIEKYMVIPINYTNEEALAAKVDGKKLMVYSKEDTVNVMVRVHKSNAGKTKIDDFNATVDLDEVIGSVSYAPSTTKFNLNVEQVGGTAYIEDWEVSSGNNVEVVVDSLVTKTMKVNFDVTGENPNGLQISELAADPAYISVSGPLYDFGSVASLKAYVDISQITSEKSLIKAPVALYDANENPISRKNLTISVPEVEVSVGLNQTKELAVAVENYSGEPMEGYKVSGMDYSPKTIVVSGSKAVLAEYSTITIPSADLNLTGVNEDQEFVLGISKYLPADVTAEEGSTAVTVKFSVEKLKTQPFNVSTNAFLLAGNRPEYRYDILDSDVTLEVNGFQSNLDAFDSEAGVQGTISVADLLPGDYTVPVMITLAAGYTLKSDVTVRIRVTDSASETQETSLAEESASEYEHSETDEVQVTDDENVETTGSHAESSAPESQSTSQTQTSSQAQTTSQVPATSQTPTASQAQTTSQVQTSSQAPTSSQTQASSQAESTSQTQSLSEAEKTTAVKETAEPESSREPVTESAAEMVSTSALAETETK